MSLAERQQTQIMAASGDTKAFGSLYKQPTASHTTARKLRQLMLAAINGLVSAAKSFGVI